jgi:hypothetical protein
MWKRILGYHAFLVAGFAISIGIVKYIIILITGVTEKNLFRYGQEEVMVMSFILLLGARESPYVKRAIALEELLSSERYLPNLRPLILSEYIYGPMVRHLSVKNNLIYSILHGVPFLEEWRLTAREKISFGLLCLGSMNMAQEGIVSIVMLSSKNRFHIIELYLNGENWVSFSIT